jgi:hypothetical protein
MHETITFLVVVTRKVWEAAEMNLPRLLSTTLATLVLSACQGSAPSAVDALSTSDGSVDAAALADASFRSKSMWFVGDSYLEGAKTYIPAAFADFKQTIFAKVGDTINGRVMFIDQAAASDARGVVIQLGINDIASGTSQTVLRQRIAATMDKLQGVACVGWPTYPTKIAGNYARVAPLAPILNGMIREEAATRPWVTVMEFGPAMDANVAQLRSGDGLHPTQAGYRLLTQMYVATLVTNCQPR